jgi:type I restriction enzyme M protein
MCEDCDLHTVLRLPKGTFTPYSHGVKANVIFVAKGVPWEGVWIYDGRTNVPGITKKDRPLTPDHFAEFEACYAAQARRAEDSPEGRWRRFTPAEVRGCEYKLDALKWLKEESGEDADELQPPEELAAEAVTELNEAVAGLNEVLRLLEQEAGV